MSKSSLKYELYIAVLPDIKNNNTLRNYKRGLRKFSNWCKENKIRHFSEISLEVVQDYCNHLIDSHYSNATIHNYLTPVCKAMEIDMKEINKPKRTSGSIVRGRRVDHNPDGARHMMDDRFQRLVKFQKAVGIRRSELSHLTGEDLIRDLDGHAVAVIVKRGKGGKRQEQMILPSNRAIVEDTFRGIALNERVFSSAEMANKINLHGMRARHAQEAYEYYLAKATDPRQAPYLRELLLSRFEAENKKCSGAKRARFLHDINNPAPYRIRGDNWAKAQKLGLPREYNRLALMAVSVYMLSHWRLDVTITNYMIQ